jgi:hypothetical protein
MARRGKVTHLFLKLNTARCGQTGRALRYSIFRHMVTCSRCRKLLPTLSQEAR